MDMQLIINFGGAALIAGIGWFCKAIWDAVTKLREDLHEIERDLPISYVRKDEYQDNLREIKEMLYKIFERLDNKEDRK